MRWDLAQIEGKEVDHDALDVEVAYQMVKALLAPLEAMDTLPPPLVRPGYRRADSAAQWHAGMTGPPLDDYLIGACEVLRGVVEEQRRSIGWSRQLTQTETDNGEA
jgi:hypothetical protein